MKRVSVPIATTTGRSWGGGEPPAPPTCGPMARSGAGRRVFAWRGVAGQNPAYRADTSRRAPDPARLRVGCAVLSYAAVARGPALRTLIPNVLGLSGQDRACRQAFLARFVTSRGPACRKRSGPPSPRRPIGPAPRCWVLSVARRAWRLSRKVPWFVPPPMIGLAGGTGPVRNASGVIRPGSRSVQPAGATGCVPVPPRTRRFRIAWRAALPRRAGKIQRDVVAVAVVAEGVAQPHAWKVSLSSSATARPQEAAWPLDDRLAGRPARRLRQPKGLGSRRWRRNCCRKRGTGAPAAWACSSRLRASWAA